MQINLNELQSMNNLLGAMNNTSASSNQSTTSFSDILSEALGDAVNADMADKQSTIELLSGEDVELSESMLASVKAELSLNLAIQIRNKVIDAYNEVMRMQV